MSNVADEDETFYHVVRRRDRLMLDYDGRWTSQTRVAGRFYRDEALNNAQKSSEIVDVIPEGKSRFAVDRAGVSLFNILEEV